MSESVWKLLKPEVRFYLSLLYGYESAISKNGKHRASWRFVRMARL